MQEFYKRSDDAVLAEKLMRLGQALAVWLTNEDDVTTFHLMHFGEDGAYIDGKLQDSLKWQTSFFAFADAKQAEFLLPIDDPVTPLQQEIALHKTTIKGFEAALELANEKVTNRSREIRELSDLRDSNNSDNRQLLEERDHVLQELRSQLEATEKLLELSTKCNVDKLNIEQHLESAKAELEITNQKLQEFSEGVLIRDRQISNYHLEREKHDRKIEILEDNLDRARSEHLEHLRALHQGLEELSNFPNVNDKLMGAIHLLIRIAYANISKLDPML